MAIGERPATRMDAGRRRVGEVAVTRKVPSSQTALCWQFRLPQPTLYCMSLGYYSHMRAPIKKTGCGPLVNVSEEVS